MRLIMDRNLITGFLIFFMLLTGCDGLDVAPTGSVTEDNYWQRVSDVEQAVNGVYVDMDGRTMGLDNRTDIAFGLLPPLVPSDDTVERYWNRRSEEHTSELQ